MSQCPYCKEPWDGEPTPANVRAAREHLEACWSTRVKPLPRELGDQVLLGQLTVQEAAALADGF